MHDRLRSPGKSSVKKDAIHALCHVLLANKTQGRIAGVDGGQFPSFKLKTYMCIDLGFL